MSRVFQIMEFVLPRRVDSLAWLMVSLTLVILPHALRMPVWVGLLCLALGAWRLFASYRNYPLPRKWLMIMMTFLAVVGVLASYRTLFGRDAGAALLIVMLALKLLEMHSLRDSMVVVFLSYFLVIINFFYSQSIPTALYMLVIVLLITATLISLNHPGSEQQVGAKLRLAFTLLAQAVPLMLILFVLFPRVPGPLWGLPKDAYSGKSGLSDEMTPGSISALSLSDAVAFRVEFTGETATAAQRYWRGPVFWDFDGHTWSMGTPLPVALQGFEVSGEACITPSPSSPMNAIGCSPWIYRQTAHPVRILPPTFNCVPSTRCARGCVMA
jgi:hypothetical protein